MRVEPGQSIAKYKLIEMLHESSDGVIYRVDNVSSGDNAILKLYHPKLFWPKEILNDFINRIDYLMYFKHRYLMPILEYGEYENVPYVVYAGDSLVLLHDYEAQPQNKNTLDFCVKIADALAFLHKQEIIHGAIQLTNIRIDEDQNPMLFDFGLNEIFRRLLETNLGKDFGLLSVTSIASTPPEILVGEELSYLSDIYAFGVVAYYYQFGAVPFENDVIFEMVDLMEKRKRRMNFQISHPISKDTPEFIQKCLQPFPGSRFSDFSEIEDVLKREQDGKRSRFKIDVKLISGQLRPKLPRMHKLILPIVLLIVVALGYVLIEGTATPLVESTPIWVPATLESKPVSSQLPAPTKIPEATVIATETALLPIETHPANFHKVFIEGESPPKLSQAISMDGLVYLQEVARLGYGKPEDISISSANSHFAIATSSGVYIYRGSERVTWIDPEGWATSVQFSPDGNMLAVGLSSGEIQLWDWASGEKETTLSFHTKAISTLLFSTNSLYLYSASRDHYVVVWNLRTKKIVNSINAHPMPVVDIAVTSDGRILLSASEDKSLRFWDVSSGSQLLEIKYSTRMNAVAISSDDAFFATGGESGYLYQYPLIVDEVFKHTMPNPRNDKAPVKERIWSIEYIRGDTELLVGVDGGGASTYDAVRKSYPGVSLNFEVPLPPSDLIDVFGASFNFDTSSVFDGQNFITINWDGLVLNQTNPLPPLQPSAYDILDHLDFSMDGSVLAVGGKRGSTRVWDLTTNTSLLQGLYVMPFGDPISPDASNIAIVINAESLQPGPCWTKEQCVYRLVSLSDESVRNLSEIVPGGFVNYPLDGTMLVSGTLSHSKTWDFGSGLETYSSSSKLNGGCRRTVSSNLQTVLQVYSIAGLFPDSGDMTQIERICSKVYQLGNSRTAISRNLNFLTYVDSKNRLQGFDLVSNKPVWDIPLQTTITALSVSHDGALVLVGNSSGQLLLLDTKTGETVGQFTGNFGALRSIEMSEDQTMIATAGDDGAVRVFGIIDR